jgi:hypothetical protein
MTSKESSGAPDANDLKDAVAIGRELAKLDDEFGRRIDKTQWLGNFQNAHIELVNVIRLADSDFHRELASRVYVAPADSLDFQSLSKYTPWEMDELTTYGQMIAKARFCAGYLGNLAQGDLLSKEDCAALIFAYEAYWNFGDDFLFGCVVEALLRRVGSPSRWTPPAKVPNGRADAVARLDLGLAIGKEMAELFTHHRSKQQGTIEASFGLMPKPDFIDFREQFLAIRAPARKATAKK